MKDLLTKRLSNRRSGVWGQISWHRLAELFRTSSELSTDERVLAFEADEIFLRYEVTTERAHDATRTLP